MPIVPRGIGRASALLLLLAGCGPGQVPASAGAGGSAYACQMRGAAAEERYAGPLGDLSIDSAMIRADATAACLNQEGRGQPARR